MLAGAWKLMKVSKSLSPAAACPVEAGEL